MRRKTKKKKRWTVYYKPIDSNEFDPYFDKIHVTTSTKPKRLPFFLKGKYKIVKVVRGWR